MRAISQDVAGGPEVLHLVDLPRPVPGPTEVLVVSGVSSSRVWSTSGRWTLLRNGL